MRCLSSFFTLVFLFVDASELITAERAHHTLRYSTSTGDPQTLRSLAFSPNSEQLAISAAGRVIFINVRSGLETGSYKASPFSMAYSRDGNRICLISESRSELVDVHLGTKVHSNLKTPDGFLGVALERRSGKLLVKRIDIGGPIATNGTIQVGDELIGLAEGRYGSMQGVVGRSVESAGELIRGPAGTFVKLKVLPRGKFAENKAAIHLVRRQTREAIGNRFIFRDPNDTAGENLAWCMTAEKHQLRDARSGLTVARLQTVDIDDRGLAAISRNQKLLAVVGRQKNNQSSVGIEVFDVATQRRLAYMPSTKDFCSDIAFAPDNNRVLIATWTGIDVADVASQKFTGRLNLGQAIPMRPRKKPRDVGSISNIHTATAGEIESGESRNDSRSPRNLVTLLAVSSKNVVATANNLGQVKLWDLNSGNLLKHLPDSPAAKPDAICFSPSGEWLAYHIKGVLHVVDVADVEAISPEPVRSASSEIQTGDGESSPLPKLDLARLAGERPFTPVVGARIEVRSRGRWYPAIITGNEGDGRWRIHYDDSPDDWDELLTLRRIRPLNDR